MREILSTLNQKLSTHPPLLRQEKDEASLLICFQQDSLDAFILRFAGIEGVSV
jgi:hypothetical protein